MNVPIEPVTDALKVEVTFEDRWRGITSIDEFLIPEDDPTYDVRVKDEGVLEVRHPKGVVFYAPGVWHKVEAVPFEAGDAS